jgi:hypothetical protein
MNFTAGLSSPERPFRTAFSRSQDHIYSPLQFLLHSGMFTLSVTRYALPTRST